jgi:AraC family transcriptional regulator
LKVLKLDRRVQITISTIEENPSRRFEIEALAKKANVSVSHFRHVFKFETGITPTQYVKQVRMHEAEKLLRTTLLSVKEIMHKVGITSESYFSREFKRSYGVPPRQYRALSGGNAANSS